MQLIGKDGSRPSRRTLSTVSASEIASSSDGNIPIVSPDKDTFSTQQPLSVEQPALDTALPAAYRRAAVEPSAYPKVATHSPTTNTWPERGEISQGISAVESRLSRQQNASSADVRLWEEIVRVDDRLVYLRRKSRQLSPETAALVLIAAAKVLLRATEGYSALLLSKALKKSGYGGERLDRVLAGEMRQGTVRSDGTKRSRLYLLSDEGFAHAYVLADKLAKEHSL